MRLEPTLNESALRALRESPLGVTSEQIAEAFQVSASTIDEWVKAGLPFVEDGNGLRHFRPSDLGPFLNQPRELAR